MHRAELPHWRFFLLDSPHLFPGVHGPFLRNMEPEFCLPPLCSALAACEWVSLEQTQASSWLLFLSVAISDAQCVNKVKTWSLVVGPRKNVSSVTFLKGWNLRSVLIQGLCSNCRMCQSHFPAQTFPNVLELNCNSMS